MKSLHIGISGTRGIPNRYGGFEQFAEKLAEGLVNKGHSVTVYNSSRHPYRQSQWNDVRIITRNEPGNWMGSAAQFVYDLNCIMHARNESYDVLLVLGYTSSALWGFLYPRRTTVILNMDGWEWKRSKYSRPVRQFLLFSEWLAVRQCDYLVADSPVIRDYLRRKFRKHSTCICYGAETDIHADEQVLSRFGLVRNGYYLLIARMVRENNIAMILEGLSGKEQSLPVLIISDTTTDYGRELHSRYETDPRFLFPGAIFDKAILHSLRTHCRLYFHGHSVGGTNPSLLEAMAAGARICAHDNPFSRAVLGKDAVYFSSSDEIASETERAVLREEWEGKRQHNLQKIHRHYQWSAIIEQYESFFYACCQPADEPNIAYTG